MTFSHTLTSFITIVRKEVVRFMRIWSQTLLPPVITQSLYFIIFGTFIGSRVGEVDGIPYMAFIIPGLVMMSVITSSFSNVVSSFFGSKFQKNIEEILVSPTPNWVIIAGFSAGGVLRGLLVGFIVFFVSLWFNPDLRIENYYLFFGYIFLTAVLFSLAGLLVAVFAKKFDDVQLFPTFVLTPLTYLGGVFYSIDRLPDFWRTVSLANPIVYMVDGFRAGFYGQSDFQIWLSLSIIVGFIIVFTGINLYLFNKGVGLKN